MKAYKSDKSYFKSFIIILVTIVVLSFLSDRVYMNSPASKIKEDSSRHVTFWDVNEVIFQFNGIEKSYSFPSGTTIGVTRMPDRNDQTRAKLIIVKLK